VTGDIHITYQESSPKSTSDNIGVAVNGIEVGDSLPSISQLQLLQTVEITSCDNEYKYELNFSPLLANDLVLVLQKMNTFAHNNAKLPPSINLQMFDPETNQYLMEIWRKLVKSRKRGSRKEFFDVSFALIFWGVIGFLVYLFFRYR
jgi:preprotein translocase subunit Sss1